MSKVYILFDVDESRESTDPVDNVLGVFRTKEAAEKFRDKYIQSEYSDTDFDDFMNEVKLDVERVAKTSFVIVAFTIKE
jgi:hypothetical protein